MIKNKTNSGQALLIVLLSLAVVLTIVLYMVSRSITDISVSTKEEDSLRAFSAAEAGIEKALIVGTGVNESIGDANFTADVTNFAEGLTSVVYPLSLKSGETATFWFAEHNSSGDLDCTDPTSCFSGSQVKFCWGDSAASEDPAMEFTFIYTPTPGVYSTARIARVAIDPNDSRRSATGNNFADSDPGGCTIGSNSFEHQKTITFASIGITPTPGGVLQFVRARSLYNTTTAQKIGMDVSLAGDLLPSQGKKIESSGSFLQSNRKIEVFQLYPTVPSIFESVMFSSGAIAK